MRPLNLSVAPDIKESPGGFKERFCGILILNPCIIWFLVRFMTRLKKEIFLDGKVDNLVKMSLVRRIL